MLDLEQLEADREKAKIDKADLFDFYHDNWSNLVTWLRAYQQGAALKDKWIDKQLQRTSPAIGIECPSNPNPLAFVTDGPCERQPGHDGPCVYQPKVK